LPNSSAPQKAKRTALLILNLESAIATFKTPMVPEPSSLNSRLR
jgi:hypothetical protein